MDIQWPLALFTLLTGMGGWTLAFVGVNEVSRVSPKSGFMPALVALIVVILGGFASVLHLTHPDRILNALSHPTSGIFVEAALVGIISVLAIVYLIVEKRQMKTPAKVFAIAAGIFGILISYMAGSSYMMIARETWNCFLLPLGYLGTAFPAGAALYWVLACAEEQSAVFMARITAVSGIVAFLTAGAYSIYSGAYADNAWPLAALVLCLSGIAVVVAGFVGMKKAENKNFARIALVCAIAGALCYRVMMWVVGFGVYNFISG